MSNSTQAQGTALSRSEQIAANRAAIFEALRNCGAVRAVANYSGSGDSGGPDDVLIRMPGNSKLAHMPLTPQYQECGQQADGVYQNTACLAQKPLDEAISDFAMDAVYEQHPGWEIDDGGSGSVVFNAAAATVLIRHGSHLTVTCRGEVFV